MDILAYGEDALTFWAMRNKIPDILGSLRDASASVNCQVFFRPSFGRRGGPGRSEFGEFDFILLTESAIYLGESKWQRSSERLEAGNLALRAEQRARHAMFKFYLKEWFLGNYKTWDEFERGAKPKLALLGTLKSFAREGTMLASNLSTILRIIRSRYSSLPGITNVLLYLHAGARAGSVPLNAGEDFVVVAIDYSEGLLDNFIRLT
jgi:hypothetical protein